jgi:Putative MetA-pathway of phenol degradation
MRSAPRLSPVAFGLALAAAAAGTPGLKAQVTEVPQTIEPGRILLRVDAVSVGLAPGTAAPNQYQALGFGTAVVSVGITKTVDFEVGTQLYLRDTFSRLGRDETHSGIGGFILRPKWTFWSDEASGQQAAIIPYVMLPTRSNVAGNQAVQGGVILPWAMDIGAGAKAGAMFEWDELRNAANTRYDTRWYASAYFKWSLGQRLGAYAETTLSDSTAGSSTSYGTVGGGAVLSLSGNFQWDFEVSKVIGPGRNAWTEQLRFRWMLF